MAWWNLIADVDELPKWYPDEAHLYTDVTSYITYNNVVYFDSDDGIPFTVNVAVTMPLYTLEAKTWNFGNVAATMPILTASGQRGNFSNAGVTLPIYTSEGLINSLTGWLAEKLPMFTIAASATQTNLVILNKALPMFKVQGTAYQYNYGSVNRSLPRMTVSATASRLLIASLAKPLPMFTVYGEASLTGRFDNVILRHTDNIWGGVAAELPMMTISAGAN